MVEFQQNSATMEPKRVQAKETTKNKTFEASTLGCNLALDRKRLEDILENIPSAVVVVEKPKGKVTYANKRAIELHGLDPRGIDIRNHSSHLKMFSLDGKVCPREQLSIYRALFFEETVRNAPLIIERPNGERSTVVVSSKPLYDEEGKVNAAVAIFDDVSEQVKTQNALVESETRLKMAQEIAHVGNWEYIIPEDKAMWSEELFRIFGLKPQQFGPNVNEYVVRIHPDDRETINKYMEQMLFKGGLASRASFDYRIVREDGSVRTIHSERLIKEVDVNQKPMKLIGIEQDITERKQFEQKLEEQNKNLEKIVEERTKQLKDVERLAAIGQTAGMIGHDIRNPLQAIDGELFLIKEEVTNSKDSQCKTSVLESLNSIQEQVDYINKIVSDLQDYARPLKPELVQIDICSKIPLLLSTVNIPPNIQAYAQCQKGLPKLQLDLTFLKRILVNLTINAIQAMPKGGKLTVRAFQKDANIILTVEDTGVGIPDKLKKEIFQPLMTTKSKGQGFGLVVAKRLVELQGGTITFESEEGKGTKFIMQFPLKRD